GRGGSPGNQFFGRSRAHVPQHVLAQGGRGSAAVVRPHDRAQGGEPDRVAAPLVTEQVSPAASAGGAPVLRAAPGDGAGPGDDEQAGPRGEGVVESSLDVADDVDLTGDLEAGECIADRAALG